jgi:predicted ester cyclase
MSLTNKDIIRNLRENAPSDLDILDGLYSEDYVYHGIPMIGDVKGPNAFKGLLNGFVSAVSGFQETVESQVAEADLVVTRLSGSGRHTGELMGAVPTGNDITWSAIVINRFENGKIAEEWASFDAYDFMQQIGALPKS